jgi:hypothetical protein
MVKSIEHAVWQGTDFIKVRGGQWSKYGVSAYEEVADAVEQFAGWRDWKAGVPYDPFEGLEKAVVEVIDGTPKRVLRFLPK